MESKAQPSAAAVQELVDSMKALYASEKGTDVTIKSEDGHEFKAHTSVICPRSKEFTHRFEHDIEYDIGHVWELEEWSQDVANMLQYMYELDYEVESQDEPVPDICTHVRMWLLGADLGIKGLKIVAAEKFKVALSQYNVYGDKIGFTISYFEDFVADVKAVWDATSDSERIFRTQVSTHIQQNNKEWAKKEGSQARFLEYAYRVLFREIQQQTRDFTAVLENIRTEYFKYLDTESGGGPSGKNTKTLVSYKD